MCALLIPAETDRATNAAILLGVARQLPANIKPLFATGGATTADVEAFGFRAEHLASSDFALIRGDVVADWRSFEVERLLDAYEATLVVHCGADVRYDVMRAVAPRDGCRFVWLRHSEAGDHQLRKEETFFDLVLDLEDLGEGTGPVKQTLGAGSHPVSIFERQEAISRKEAARALDLDPARPAALIRVDTSERPSNLMLIDTVVRALRASSEIQVVVVDRDVGLPNPPPWPDVTIVNGLAIGQYLNAFDFSVATASYDVFYEHLAQGIRPSSSPTDSILHQPSAVAWHLQKSGVALHLDDVDSPLLPQMLQVMMVEGARARLRDACGLLRFIEWHCQGGGGCALIDRQSASAGSVIFTRCLTIVPHACDWAGCSMPWSCSSGPAAMRRRYVATAGNQFI